MSSTQQSPGSRVRVEYRKMDDRHIRILTYHPGRKEPIETIATLLPPKNKPTVKKVVGRDA